jgi:hypothetical protein
MLMTRPSRLLILLTPSAFKLLASKCARIFFPWVYLVLRFFLLILVFLFAGATPFDKKSFVAYMFWQEIIRGLH